VQSRKPTSASRPLARSHVTFHARVAGAALATTVAVLAVACLTFMFQQWAVAREQSNTSHQVLAEITAANAARAVLSGRIEGAQAALTSAARAPRLLKGEIRDAEGRRLATYDRPGSAGHLDGAATVTADMRGFSKVIGKVSLWVEKPRLGELLPQFIALTAALFFAGMATALFLARGMAHRVIAPVQQLSDAMRDVAERGAFEPVKVDASDSLFRSLTDSFNHLLSKLDDRDRDLKRTMNDLVEARDAADAANTLKSQFLANMSHEIRTPLNGVLAMADVMAMSDLPPLQRERLGVIRQSGELLLAVLNDVLDLSKIEAGKLTLLESEFDLDRLAASSRDTFSQMAKDKGLTFDVEVAAEAGGWWRGDADRIRQILNNLTSNAIKFTPDGAVQARFDINPVNGALRLQVADTGVGVSEEKLPTLFEKFVQADNSATRRFGGTGLGLAICRELAQMMGGVISAKSLVYVGSTFTVELPLEHVAAPAVVAEASNAAEEGEETDIRLLAAEDNPTNQRVLQAVMDSLGLHVDIVPDGRAAVEAWKTGAYDLILMDIQMPVMDGIAAAKAIRDTEWAEQRKAIPIIALTANALSHQVEEYLAAGMDGHVSKPIEIAKLYDALNRALAGQTEAQAA
jgi:signal transduction histidine kinase/ActR/RegA family two-component response regulator